MAKKAAKKAVKKTAKASPKKSTKPKAKKAAPRPRKAPPQSDLLKRIVASLEDDKAEDDCHHRSGRALVACATPP